MGVFERNSALAVTWDQSACRLVRMRLRGNLCVVDKFWSGSIGNDRSMPELVEAGMKELGWEESAFLVIGGDNSGWGMADVTMPPLGAEELRNALAFELKKQTPLPVEKLHWGYRVLSGNAAKNMPLRVRLYFIKMEQWNRWMRNLEAVKQVDAVIPAPAALNPLGNGSKIILPSGSGEWIEFDSENGNAITVADEKKVSLKQALPAQIFNCQLLESLPQDEQLAYIPAIVLGAYGMTEACSNDAKTLASVPEKLLPHRNITLKVLACMLVVYLVLLAGFVCVSRLNARSNQIRVLEREINLLKEELKEYIISGENEEKIKQLKAELTSSTVKIPEFPLVLLDITRIIEAPLWVSQAIDWKNGMISLQVQSQFKDLELAAKLEDSSYIGDVMERSASFSQLNGMYTQRFDMVARFDGKVDIERLASRVAAGKVVEKQEKSDEEEEPVVDEPEEENSETAEEDGSQGGEK